MIYARIWYYPTGVASDVVAVEANQDRIAAFCAEKVAANDGPVTWRDCASREELESLLPKTPAGGVDRSSRKAWRKHPETDEVVIPS